MEAWFIFNLRIIKKGVSHMHTYSAVIMLFISTIH
jgi:hypothetical protein